MWKFCREFWINQLKLCVNIYVVINNGGVPFCMAKHGTDYNKLTDAPDSQGVQYEDVRMYKSKAIKERIYN